MKRIPPKLQPWFEARQRFKLSHAQIQMARELGMNPKKFGSLANEKQEPWKVPLREFIAQCYRKSFGPSEPEHVRSLEQLMEAHELRRKRKQDRKAQSDGHKTEVRAVEMVRRIRDKQAQMLLGESVAEIIAFFKQAGKPFAHPRVPGRRHPRCRRSV